MEGLIMLLFFVIIFIFFTFIRVVPANTVLIIDRNTHYLKTKRHGFFFLNPATDKITSTFSKYPVTKMYTNFFETHDGYIVQITFTVRYHVNDLDSVVNTLALVRRSVDDVMEGSVYWGVNNLSISDFANKSFALSHEVKPQLIAEASELEIIIDDFTINGITPLPKGSNIIPFKPHTSSNSGGPIKFY